MDMEMYLDMSIVHTQGDREVDWKELEEAQRELRAYSWKERSCSEALRMPTRD